MMNFSVEELLPVVGKLAEKYTGWESTSITYEKAEQLMEAVLYCIREMDGQREGLVSQEKMSAEMAYELGYQCVVEKVKETLDLYHKILPDFSFYENRCLRDTFLKGIPEFFRWYDVKFEPQNTILTLDYPVLVDLSGCSGIDRIHKYLACIHVEQKFLQRFPEEEVIHILSRYNKHHRDMIENICDFVLLDIAKKMVAEAGLTGEQEIKDFLRSVVPRLVQEYYGGDEDLCDYLSHGMDNVITRILICKENFS